MAKAKPRLSILNTFIDNKYNNNNDNNNDDNNNFLLMK